MRFDSRRLQLKASSSGVLQEYTEDSHLGSERQSVPDTGRVSDDQLFMPFWWAPIP